MKKVIVQLVAGLVVLSNGSAVWGQVDPAWLSSWNHALAELPETITSQGRIAPEDEPGEPFVIRGTVVTPDGKPASGVLINAYHRDRDGVEFASNDTPPSAWKLHGWARANAEGQFEFQTIRPAPDNLGREAAHIHFTLVSDRFGRQWAPKVFLSDDPMVPARERSRSEQAGEFGWVLEPQTEAGVQYLDVKIRLKDTADF